MSRKGNKLISLPAGIKNVNIIKNADGSSKIGITGTLGSTFVSIPAGIIVVSENNTIKVSRENNEKKNIIMHGTIQSLINSAVIGVSTGFVKTLNIVGVGYKMAIKGNELEIFAGFSGSGAKYLKIPSELKVTCPTPTQVVITGISKELVGQFAALVRNVRKPEPYNGKGIAYSDEIIIRKVGKTAEGSKK